MPTYYESLKIEPTAASSEIEAAYETQYTQWRRLVTHHAPEVVQQANQALQQLERIRTTLLDPSRRAAYDAGIGIGGPVGGLADPSAFLDSLQAPPVPPAPSAPPAARAGAPVMAAAPAQRGLWSCYKCSTDNPPNTKFCFQCGTQLVRQCPECKNDSSLVATGMCGVCGYKYDDATGRQVLRDEFATNTEHMVEVEQRLAESKISSSAKYYIGALFICFGLYGMASAASGAALMFVIAAGLFWSAAKDKRSRDANTKNIEAQKDQLMQRQVKLALELLADDRQLEPELRDALQEVRMRSAA